MLSLLRLCPLDLTECIITFTRPSSTDPAWAVIGRYDFTGQCCAVKNESASNALKRVKASTFTGEMAYLITDAIRRVKTAATHFPAGSLNTCTAVLVGAPAAGATAAAAVAAAEEAEAMSAMRWGLSYVPPRS